MRNFILGFFLFAFGVSAHSAGETKFKSSIFNGSVAIGSTAAANAKSVLDVTSTTKAALLPRMTTTQRDAISSPATGSLIYNTSLNVYQTYTGAAWVSAGGDLALAAVGSSPNANGASVSSLTLTLQPADATNPGVVTTGTQTFAGAKTFSSTIVGSVNGNAATATKPAAGSAYGVVVLDASGNFASVAPGTTGKVLTSNGTSWESATAAGGGGGGISIKWLKTGGNSPTNDVYSLDEVELFDATLAQELYTTFKIPATYTAGNPVKIRMVYSSPDTSGTILFTAVSTLLAKDSTAFTSTTNQRTSTNSAAALSATANRINEAILDVSHTDGTINAVAIAAGDVLKIKLTRGTDTATSQARLHTNIYEVTIQ